MVWRPDRYLVVGWSDNEIQVDTSEVSRKFVP